MREAVRMRVLDEGHTPRRSRSVVRGEDVRDRQRVNDDEHGFLCEREYAPEAARVSVEDRPAAFAAAGLYQLTPLKDLCLSHCRSPLGLLLHYGSYRGKARDLRVGVHHGGYCLGCCWALMVILIAVGVMNIAAMVGPKRKM